MHKTFTLIVCCLFMSTAMLSQEISDTSLESDSVIKKKYTFGDFFDALDLPTVLGAGITPYGIESATFNSAMRLGWRQHKNYGAFVYVTYDAHSNTYDSLAIDGTNVSTGEVWYHEVGLGAGYRIPLVKDIKAFYENPTMNSWDFYFAVYPTIVIDIVKKALPASMSTENSNSNNYYRLDDVQSVTPSLRFSAGVEWFIFSNFGVFAECAYIQHLMPTMVEKAAIEQGRISTPQGAITLSIGLSLFFN